VLVAALIEMAVADDVEQAWFEKRMALRQRAAFGASIGPVHQASSRDCSAAAAALAAQSSHAVPYLNMCAALPVVA